MRNQWSEDDSPLALILGTNEIASATAVHLRKSGWRCLLGHDPYPPVIRRGMAFYDALFCDDVALEGVRAKLASSGVEILAALSQPRQVVVTPLHLCDIIPVCAPDLLVDARMQKHCVTPDWRHVARLTVGLGPNFAVGRNCDIAIETIPAKAGAIIRDGATEAHHPAPQRLGDLGAERFVYSPRAGLWHTALDIGARVFKDFPVGHLGQEPIRAPLDGVLRGVVRDGLTVPSGVKLLEIDGRGRAAAWTGVDDRARTIAQAVVRGVKMKQAQGAHVLPGPFVMQ